MAYGTYKAYEKAFQPHPSGRGGVIWPMLVAPLNPPHGGRVACSLIMLMGLIELIGHIWLMRESFGAPLPLGGAGRVGNMAHIGW